jgi:hypothetical protein
LRNGVVTLAGLAGGIGLAAGLLATGFGWTEAFLAYGLGAPALVLLLGSGLGIAPSPAPVRRVAAVRLGRA